MAEIPIVERAYADTRVLAMAVVDIPEKIGAAVDVLDFQHLMTSECNEEVIES